MPGSLIGFLATGDEVCDGDITNTNTPTLARLLREHGWRIGDTVCVPDNEERIIDGLAYLAPKHDVIITTGGLGPTEDDRTRYALARFVNQQLVFNDASWQRLYDRLTHYLKLSVPDNNRQQALFPAQASVLANDRGSADSCWLEYDDTIFFMLPGPPRECLGVMHDHVLSLLASHPKLIQTNTILLKWFLLGASEGHIATELEAALQDFNCRTGYRAEYPYLECKVWVDDPKQQQTIKQTVDQTLQPHCLMPTPQIASQYCHDVIAKQQHLITIDDQVTAGQLQTLLTSGKTHHLLNLTNGSNPTNCHLHIFGLTEFWRTDFSSGLPPAGLITTVNLDFRYDDAQKQAKKDIPIRNRMTNLFAAEWISYQLAQWLVTIHHHA